MSILWNRTNHFINIKTLNGTRTVTVHVMDSMYLSKSFETIKNLFVLEEEGCNYNVTTIEIRKPDRRGFCHAELVCDANSLGGTGRWGCGIGHIDFTKLPLEIRQQILGANIVLCIEDNDFVHEW